MNRPDDAKEFSECPRCGATMFMWQNRLTDEEYTNIVSCGDCPFEIETVSNKAAEARRRRRHDNMGQHLRAEEEDGEVSDR